MSPGLESAFNAIDEFFAFERTDAAKAADMHRSADAMRAEMDAVAARLARMLHAYMDAGRAIERKESEAEDDVGYGHLQRELV